jgi:hypothetical protein
LTSLETEKGTIDEKYLNSDVFNVKNQEMVENLNITERERNEKKMEFWRNT